MYMADKKQIKTPTPTPRQPLCFLSAWLLGSYLLGMNTFKNVCASVTGCGVLKVKKFQTDLFFSPQSFPLGYLHVWMHFKWHKLMLLSLFFFSSVSPWVQLQCSLFSVKHSDPPLSAGHKLPVFRSNLTWRRLATWTLRLSVAFAVVFWVFCFSPTVQWRAQHGPRKTTKEKAARRGEPPRGPEMTRWHCVPLLERSGRSQMAVFLFLTT